MDFTNFRKYYKIDSTQISDEWLSWFIGFFEGDGSITIDTRKDKNYLIFVITQREGNKFILEEIRDTLKIGSVNVQGKHITPGRLWTYRFQVTNLKDFHKILLILNNNLILPERRYFLWKVINIYNINLQRSKDLSKNNQFLKFKDVDYIENNNNNSSLETIMKNPKLPSEKDHWLVGFTDAAGTSAGTSEGCFSISILSNSSTSTSAFRIRYILGINSRPNSTIEYKLKILEKVKQILKVPAGSITYRKKNSEIVFIEFRADGLKNIRNVIDYFNFNSLKTNKNLNFLILKETYEKLIKKEHLDTKLRENLINLIKNKI